MKLLAIHSLQYGKMCDILPIDNMITFQMCDMPNKKSFSCKRAWPSKVESMLL